MKYRKPTNDLYFKLLFISNNARAADGTRTHGLVLTKDALYQLSYSSTAVVSCRCYAARTDKTFCQDEHVQGIEIKLT